MTINDVRFLDEWWVGRQKPEDEGPVFFAMGYLPGKGSFGRVELREASGKDQYEARENLFRKLEKL